MLRSVLCLARCSVPNLCGETQRSVVDVSSRAVQLAFLPISCGYHTTSVLNLGRDIRKRAGGKFPTKKLEAIGESSMDISSASRSVTPDETTPTQLFNGIMFKDLPIIHVKATKNNTHIGLSDCNGQIIAVRTCGQEGFKNARKGTNVAAQATAYYLGKRSVQKGHNTVRVRVSGLGAGRLASVKGLTLAGVNVVSITDYTPISFTPPRPRKIRRI